MSSELIVSTKKAKAIVPPLKKSEIIHAMALRSHAQLTEQAQKDNAAHSAAQAELYRLIVEHFEQLPRLKLTAESVSNYLGYTHNKHVSVRFGGADLSLEKFTPEMKAQYRIMERIDKARTRCVPEFNDIKRSIRDAMTGNMTNPSERVSALLADPATCKAIDKMLAELDGTAKTTIAA